MTQKKGGAERRRRERTKFVREDTNFLSHYFASGFGGDNRLSRVEGKPRKRSGGGVGKLNHIPASSQSGVHHA